MTTQITTSDVPLPGISGLHICPPKGLRGHRWLGQSDVVLAGEIDSFPFCLMRYYETAVAFGKGWETHALHGDDGKITTWGNDRRYKATAADDPEFRRKVTQLVQWLESQPVHDPFSEETWPAASKIVDTDGCAEHPLFEGKGSHWVCVECDTTSDAKTLVDNHWHCPTCHGSPAELFRVQDRVY